MIFSVCWSTLNLHISISLSKTATCLGSCFLASKVVAENHSVPPFFAEDFGSHQKPFFYWGVPSIFRAFWGCPTNGVRVYPGTLPGSHGCPAWSGAYQSCHRCSLAEILRCWMMTAFGQWNKSKSWRISPKRGFQHRKAWRYGRNAGELMGICECRGPCPLYTLRWFKMV